MKKFIPAILPFFLIGLLIAVLFNSSRLRERFNPGFDDTSPRDVSPHGDESGNYTPPIVPAPLDEEEAAPKAILVEDNGNSAPSYSATEYPFVNRPYKWKPQKAWSYKNYLSFNSDGTVSQDFLAKGKVNNLSWWPNQRYSIILSDGKDWTVDISFDAAYNKFTARSREGEEIYAGKLSR